MTSAEERRAVADNLLRRTLGLELSYGSVANSLNDGWVYQSLAEILEAIGCENDTHPAHWLLRLADLIDPMCGIVRGDDCNLYCSECGGIIGYKLPGQDAFIDDYCRGCGAKVDKEDFE